MFNVGESVILKEAIYKRQKATVRSVIYYYNSNDIWGYGLQSEIDGYVEVPDSCVEAAPVEKTVGQNLYWASFLVQETENSRPWLCSSSTGCSFENAMETIKMGRKVFRVLSAWIDTFDENGDKITVFHECYVNAIGTVDLGSK